MKKSVLFLLVVSLFFVPVVYGLGIASDYFPNDVVPLAPGAFFEYRVNIQNGGSSDLSVELLIGDPDNVVSLNGSSVFELPARSYGLWVPLYISIPWYAKEGDIYPISYQVGPVVGPGGGGIPFTISVSRSFSVNVTEDGFIARGVRAEKRTLSTITAQAVKSIGKNIYAVRGTIGTGLLVIFLLGFVMLLVWKRSGMIVDKTSEVWNGLFAKRYVDEEDLSYRTLPEFYRVMTGIDGVVFKEYMDVYWDDVYKWLASVSSHEFAYWVMSASSRKEFFQRLKYGLRK
ncbi:hypothetical protein HY484_04025 [Candidatus Woesearchaeota archaeon]|nr:hypothetical protein [Candidatus Woesearchaeota archaeon]